MENRRFLGTYKIRNISGSDLGFTMTFASGLSVDQTLEAGEFSSGITPRGLRLIAPWVESGQISIAKEYEYVESKKLNWKTEGF